MGRARAAIKPFYPHQRVESLLLSIRFTVLRSVVAAVFSLYPENKDDVKTSSLPTWWWTYRLWHVLRPPRDLSCPVVFDELLVLLYLGEARPCARRLRRRNMAARARRTMPQRRIGRLGRHNGTCL